MKTMIRTYNELILLPTFDERFEYLKLLDGKIGAETFGQSRYINQAFYRSPEWKSLRNQIIIRDLGCDLGVEGYEIMKRAYIHHINPVTREQLINRDPIAWDPENLITVSQDTHNAIHFGLNPPPAMVKPIERIPGDTCPWRRE